jgi:LuxR family maltose regulon positive regulatory protein
MHPLLTTKLFPPPVPGQLLSRQRLLARLDEHYPIILVSAPPGFGKTTLIIDWLKRHPDMPTGWLSLDEDDNALPQFLAYLASACQSAVPSVGGASLLLLGSSPVLDAKAVLSTLINDLSSLDRGLVLVLDDYHRIHSPDVHQAIDYLLDHLPGTLRVVLATRGDPPLHLARLRGRGVLLQVGVADLRFTLDETRLLLSQFAGLRLSDADLEALQARTEGWVSGLQMAALSIRTSEYPSAWIATFTGSQRFIGDYLAEEVFNQQTERIRGFLLHTSILDRLCAPLCDALMGWEESGEILERLMTENLFLVPLDDRGTWYRYHHLFGEFLNDRLDRSSRVPEQVLHTRACDWYARNGYILEAVRHALRAGQPERAASLVQEDAANRIARGEIAHLLSQVELLPVDQIRSNPRLSLYLGIARFMAGALELAEGSFRDAESSVALLPSEEAGGVRAEIEAFRLGVSIEREVRPGDIERGERLLAKIHPENHLLRATLFHGLGHAYLASEDLKAALEAFAESKRVAEASQNLLSELITGYEQAEIYLAMGQLHQAESVYRQALAKIERQVGGQAPVPIMGGTYIGLGKLLYERNELQAAREQLERGIQLAKQPGGLGLSRHGLLSLAFVALAQARRAEANRHLQKTEELVRNSPRSDALSRFVPEKIRFWLLAGNLKAAGYWAEEIETKPSRTAAEEIALARVWLVQGGAERLAKAIKILDERGRQAASLGRAGTWIEVQLLKALVFHALGQDWLALPELEICLRQAEPENYVRLFLNEGKPAFELLALVHRRGVAPEYVQRLLSALGESNRKTTVQPLVEPLTNRELQVLALLAEGNSNAQIGDRLVITSGTVKRHTLSIYQKLGVNSRTQAIALARELNLLADDEST